jgi:hypothetical protein
MIFWADLDALTKEAAMCVLRKVLPQMKLDAVKTYLKIF